MQVIEIAFGNNRTWRHGWERKEKSGTYFPLAGRGADLGRPQEFSFGQIKFDIYMELFVAEVIADVIHRLAFIHGLLMLSILRTIRVHP